MNKEQRQCRKCKKWFPLNKKYFHSKGLPKLSYSCKSCENIRRRKYPSYASKEAIKRRDDKKTKNITDSYVKKCLKIKEPSQDIIELKRLQIKLIRAIKSCKST